MTEASSSMRDTAAGGQRRMRQNTGKPKARRKRDRPAVASFVDDAAGEGFAGEDRLGAGNAAEQVSQDQYSDQHSDQYSASQGSGAASDGYLSAEDAYAEEDWEELQQAEAGAAGAGAMSEGSLSGQMPDGSLGNMLQDAGADQREPIMHQAGAQGRPGQAAFARPEGAATATGKTPALADCACGRLL